MKLLSRSIFAQLALVAACHAAAWKNLRGLEDPNIGVTAEVGARVNPHVDPHVEVLKKDANKTYRKAMNMRPDQMFVNDMKLMASYLFPGQSPQLNKKICELCVALLGILWLIPYYNWWYADDQEYEAKWLLREEEEVNRIQEATAEELKKEIEIEKEKEHMAMEEQWAPLVYTAEYKSRLADILQRDIKENDTIETCTDEKMPFREFQQRFQADDLPKAFPIKVLIKVAVPEPDLVIKFFNPACTTYTDNDKPIPRGALKSTLGHAALKDVADGEKHIVPRIRDLLKIRNESVGHRLSKSLSRALSMKTDEEQHEIWSPLEYTEDYMSKMQVLVGHEVKEDQLIKTIEDEEMTITELKKRFQGDDLQDAFPIGVKIEKTFGTVRAAILQDLYELLPKKGFTCTIFNSIDKDELFLCISLTDKDACAYHLNRNGTRLQIQFDVVKDLGVKQDPTEIASDPPYIGYDSRLASNIMRGGDKTDLDFYRVFPGPGYTQTTMNSTDRIRAIIRYLRHVIDLDLAVKENFIVGWFPSHTRDGIVEFRTRWSNWLLLKDLSFVQPISLLNDYFGSRVAFLFAWNGCYCKLLLALVPIATIFEAANFVAIRYGQNPFWNRRSLLGFGIVIAVWTRFASNVWKRQQNYLVIKWDLHDAVKDAQKRTEFIGEMQTSPIDSTLQVKVYPTWKFQLRQSISWLITTLFCMFNFFCLMLWIDLWDGRLTPSASIVLAVLIQIFTQIFNWMAEEMTEHENHQFVRTYYESYLMKMFFFQFINQYSAFFYIAVKQQFTETGCPKIDVYDNDCVGLLNEQLPMTLVVLSFTRVVQTVVATLLVQISFWLEDRAMRNEGMTVVQRTFLENQGKFQEFRVREQVEATVQLALTLGYVLIFGAVAPRIIILTLIVFMVQLRAGAVLVVNASTRTIPRKTKGIGPLASCLKLLVYIGMAFSGYLLVNFGPLFKGTMLLTRVSGFLVWGLFVIFIWQIVDFVFSPSHDKHRDMLEARRAYVMKKLVQKNSEKMYAAATRFPEKPPPSPQMDDNQPSSARRWMQDMNINYEKKGEYFDKVENAQWNDIPTLIQKAEEHSM